MENKICPSCGKMHDQGTRKDLGIKCDDNELNGIKIINNRMSCAMQALNPNAIPKDVDEKNARIFVMAAMDYKAEIDWLNEKWWEEMIQKYNLNVKANSKDIHIDFADGSFYILE